MVHNLNMTKKPLFISLAVLACMVARSQDNTYWLKMESLLKFSKSYFRSDPFTGEFSGFLKHLINDPAISEKLIQKRTDTSLYYFYGIYTSYNPFFFKPKRVEILLEETPMTYEDSLYMTDTIFTYQLLAYANDDAAGNKETKKEFEKIHRLVHRKFESNYKEVKEGNEITTAVHNYFIHDRLLSPLSIAWGRLEKQQELFLNITLRVKMDGNRSMVPVLRKK